MSRNERKKKGKEKGNACNMYVFISSDKCHEQEELRNSASIQKKRTPILRGNLIKKL